MTSSRNLAVLTDARIERSGRTILDRVNFTVTAGSLTVVAGANGSGKSTLLAVLAGLHPVTEGQFRTADGIRRALVPQRSEAADSLPLTVQDVIGMGRWFGPRKRTRAEDRAVTAMCVEAVGLTGLEGRLLGELSGGQRQRALLGQGLAQRADILLLDEPTTGLDEEAIDLLEECISVERTRGAAVVLVSHERTGAFGSASRVLVDGQTVTVTPSRNGYGRQERPLTRGRSPA